MDDKKGYMGPERRENHRRSTDRCVLCEVLWKNHDEEKRNAREGLCRKIGEAVKDIESMQKEQHEIEKLYTPRWVFRLVISSTFVFSLMLFGWTATTIKDGQRDVKESLQVLHQRISKNDADVSADTEELKKSLNNLGHSMQSIDQRLKTVEKYVESRGGK